MGLRRLDYVPVLKWRGGECMALERLTDGDRDWITPLLEITPPEFDFETRTLKKTLDQHFAPFGKRLKTKWGTRPAFIDTRFLSPTDRLLDTTHPLAFLMTAARAVGARLTPVTSLQRDLAHDNALAEALEQDGRGLALRCSLDEFADPGFNTSARKRLECFGLDAASADLLIDLADSSLEPAEDLADLLISCLQSAAIVGEARSLVMLGTGFPRSMGEVKKGVQSVPRKEWKLYKALANKLPAGVRRPTFGDYAISSPELVTGDMRRLKPAATVRVAVEDAWIIAKGGASRGNLAQFKALCGQIMEKSPLAEGMSAGGDYIRLCAVGKASTGNQTTWRWVGTNHHLTMVLADLARLYAP